MEERGYQVCEKCGSEIEPGDTFCTMCGAMVTASTPVRPVKPVKPVKPVEKDKSRSGDWNTSTFEI